MPPLPQQRDSPTAPEHGVAPALTLVQTETMNKTAAGTRNPIQIGFCIYSVTKVDAVEGTFAADLKVFCRWHDGGMAFDPDIISLNTSGTFANGSACSKDAKGEWPPFVVKEIEPELVAASRLLYTFSNAMDVEIVDGTETVYLSPNDPPGWVRSETRYRGQFLQMMELSSFPFDAQFASISIRLPNRRDVGRPFVQLESSSGPQMEMKDWVHLPEWSRYEPEGTATTDSKGRARYVITLPLVRRYDYYVWNICAVISSITFLAFTSFAIDATDVPGRSSVVLTLLLTAVAFKLVVSDSLPKVSYWTIMDWYMNAMFLMLLVIALENGCVGFLAANYEQTWAVWGTFIEALTFVLVFGVWLAFHIGFGFHCSAVRAAEMVRLHGKVTANEAAAKRRQGLAEDRAHRGGSYRPAAEPGHKPRDQQVVDVGDAPRGQPDGSGYEPLKETVDEAHSA